MFEFKIFNQRRNGSSWKFPNNWVIVWVFSSAANDVDDELGNLHQKFLSREIELGEFIQIYYKQRINFHMQTFICMASLTSLTTLGQSLLIWSTWMGEITHILSPPVPFENTNDCGLRTKVWVEYTYTSFLGLARWQQYGKNEDYNFQDCWLDILDGIKSSNSIVSRFVYKQGMLLW